jgi:hypothetical protein
MHRPGLYPFFLKNIPENPPSQAEFEEREKEEEQGC